MKAKWVLLLLSIVLLTSACVPNAPTTETDSQSADGEEKQEETVIIPEVQIKDSYYRTLLPFKKSASRGLIVNNLRTKYDIKEAEEGLLRLSADHFSTSKSFFQEGQYIDEATAKSWLSRQSDKNKEGLNPQAPEGVTDEQLASQAPIYLAHIVEQNYLVMTGEKKVKLEGISLGLALNSVYYTRDGHEERLSDAKVEEQGKQMAKTIVERLREQEGLKDIPIVVGLFKQEERSSIIPGAYFATAIAEKGKELSGWKPVREKYVVFPSGSAEEEFRDMNNSFQKFKQAIDDYFPSFVNVIGRGLYVDDQLVSLNVEVPIQFFGSSEIIGFTQYVTGLVTTHLPGVPIEVNITSINGPEALIVSKNGQDEPFVHIYGN